MKENNNFSLLEKAGLYGRGLLSVREKVNVDRYNACLKEIGIEPTELSEFEIDGIGYSPQIAKEKNSRQYLSLDGISNPYVIILSPEQEGLPIYHPYYSFYRKMMGEVFRTFHRQITDLTLRTAIYIDLDEGLSKISSSDEFLLIEGLVLKFNVIGSVADAAKQQRELVLKLGKETNWGDNDLIKMLSDNIAEHGDLRYQHMQLTNFPFMDIRSFFSPDFGGVYIFREIDPKLHIVINASNPSPLRVKNHHVEYSFGDPDLYERLIGHKIIDLDPSYYKRTLSVEKLERLAFCLFVTAFTSNDRITDIKSLTTGQIKKNALQLISQGKLSPLYEELLSLAHMTNIDRVAQIETISPELQKLLVHPHKDLKKTGSAREVVHRLISHMMPVDIIDLYAYARETFFEFYTTWPTNKQKWVVEFLSEHYISRTKKQKLNKINKSKNI